MATRHQTGGAGAPPRGATRIRRRLAPGFGALAVLVAAVTGGGAAVAVPGGTEPTGSSVPRSGTTVPSPPGTAPILIDPGAPTPRTEAMDACLVDGAQVVDADPVAEVPFPDRELELLPGGVLDARGSQFDNTELDRSGFGFGVRIRPNAPEGVCFLGGTIRTTIEPEDTPWSTWHRVAGIEVDAPGVTVVGTTFRNQGDLIAFLGRADDWAVVGVRADGGREHLGAYAHDDCVENDAMLAGLVIDSKFDGCFGFLSSTRASDTPLDGGDNQVAVRSTLVRLQPYRNSFDTEKYGFDRHGGFFKWARTDGDVMIPPKLVVTDSIFRSDDAARFGGNENGFLGLPDGTQCERVVLIGTETWPADDLASWTEQCDDLTLGTVADWDAAVARWDAAHPPLRDLAGQGRDAASGIVPW